MHRLLIVPSLLLTAVGGLVAGAPPSATPDPITIGPIDWPWWRGPSHDGHADPRQSPPQKWSETENVVWKATLPGRGHGSACVVGERVLLCTANAEAQTMSVLCLDRAAGTKRWETIVHRGGFESKGNAKASLASCTPASDGRRVFVNFLHAGAVFVTALDLEGKQLWQAKACDFVMHQGYGASPAVVGPLVVVAADNKGGGAIVAFDRVTGKEAWRRPRPELPNYASPILLTASGRQQLVFTGCDLVTSLDPLTGKELWETKGSTTECVTSVATDGIRVFTSGGYPKNHVSAVRADGSGASAWTNGARVYVPSMFVRAGHLYAVTDAGFAVCWKCDSGKELWNERLGGTFSASPVPVGDTVYATNETGKTYVYTATPDAFQLLAENQLGSESMATPTICGGRIYLRVAHKRAGQREEVLYCLGTKAR